MEIPNFCSAVAVILVLVSTTHGLKKEDCEGEDI
jgi:hypothetical protein